MLQDAIGIKRGDTVGVGGGKQLLRVRATPPGAPEGARRGERHLQHAVGRHGAPSTAASGRHLRLVEYVVEQHGLLLLCEFARKKENPSLERYIEPPSVLSVLDCTQHADVLPMSASFSAELPVIRGRGRSHASSCLFVR